MSHHVVLVVLIAAGAVIRVPLCAAQTSGFDDKKIPRVEQAAKLVADGVAAIASSDLATAASLFEHALKLNPNNSAAHTYLGMFADRAGDLLTAERHFAAAAAADQSSPSARNNLGAVLLKRGFPRQAAKQFEASLNLDRNQPSALFNLAQIRFSGGTLDDLRAARDLFARAYSTAPDAEGARALVVVSLRLGEREPAAKYYREYTEQLSGSGIGAPPASARAELGAALLEAGLFKEAEAELTAAIQMEPRDHTSVLRLARVYLAGKDLPAAGKTLEAAVARGLDVAPIYALLASVYEQSGHIENAIPAMRLAVQRDPQSESYRFDYGMLLAGSLAPRAAVIRLTEALEQFPRSARLWFALGIAHFKAGMNDEAAKALTRAKELDPKFAPALAYLGMTYVERGQYDEATRFYEQALAVNEKLGVVDFLIADVLLKRADADDVLIESHLVRAVKLDPSFAPARLALGKLYFRTNRLAEAVGELEGVIKLDPNLAQAYYQLGRVYARLKRTAEAEAMLATFKRLSETQKDQQQNERREIVRRLANVHF